MNPQLYPVIAVILLCAPVLIYCEVQHYRSRKP